MYFLTIKITKLLLIFSFPQRLQLILILPALTYKMSTKKHKCARCGSDDARVYMESGARCLSCLRIYLSRTFRTALGRASASGASATFAVGLSGDVCSASAAHLTHEYVHSLRRPPGITPPAVLLLHVRCDASAEASARECASLLPGAKLVVIALPSAEEEALARVRDTSDRALLRRAFVRGALSRAARNVSALVLGTSATRRAAMLLEAVVCARPAVARGEEVCRIVEPLCDVRSRLLVRYARYSMPGVSFVAHAVENSPIAVLVDRFVAEAERDNPSAVHNVVRTAVRLRAQEGNPCALCGTPVHAGGSATGANGSACGAADDGDRCVSGCSSEGKVSGGGCVELSNGSGSGGCCGKAASVCCSATNRAETIFCSGCEGIAKRGRGRGGEGLDAINELLEQRSKQKKKEQNRQAMRNQIEEYLIDVSDEDC